MAFNNAINENQTSFLEQINLWVEKGLEKEVQEKFYSIHIYDLETRNKFENIISGIFYLANLNTVNLTVYTFNNLVGYNSFDLVNKLSDSTRIIHTYYSVRTNEKNTLIL